MKCLRLLLSSARKRLFSGPPSCCEFCHQRYDRSIFSPSFEEIVIAAVVVPLLLGAIGLAVSGVHVAEEFAPRWLYFLCFGGALPLSLAVGIISIVLALYAWDDLLCYALVPTRKLAVLLVVAGGAVLLQAMTALILFLWQDRFFWNLATFGLGGGLIAAAVTPVFCFGGVAFLTQQTHVSAARE